MRKNNKGFTLAELLIVVAIIGVLVAIAIPIFSGQLKKAKLATDQANVRSAKAAAAAEYMSDGESGSVRYLYDGGHVVPLNASNVSQLSSVTSASGYGKSSTEDNKNDQTGASGTPKNSYVEVTINGSGQITAMWVAGAAVFESSGGDLLLTGNAISNGSIMDQINAMGVDPSSIRKIVASEGSKIDVDTTSVFKGLTNLQEIDLTNATLIHSSYDMFADMPESVQKIELPNSTSSYNIRGTWYDKNGNKLPIGNYAPKGQSKSDYSRVDIENLHTGETIYRVIPNRTA